jgi:hypothetical protein
MKCDEARQNIVLVTYGELPDEETVALERHLEECEGCRAELTQLLTMHEALAERPVLEPSPNLLAQARMRLDEELDQIPPRGLLTRLRANFHAWLGHLASAPALATLLLGVGFLGGNFLNRYEVAHAPKTPAPVIVGETENGKISDITGITQQPNSEVVQVSYERTTPETVVGSLDDPQIRQLLMMGAKAAANNGVRTDSVSLLANECREGHECVSGSGSIRNALMASLRTDKNPSVRLAALDGLQPYVAEDERVRDAVLQALMHDANADVRTHAINMLQPVDSDSSVRQAMRTVSTTDDNPYIRNTSMQVLQGSPDIQ